jgi:hypothetical protein
MSRGPYTVTLLDADGCVMASDELDTVSQARTSARTYITDPEYIDAHKVEVCDADGVCVFDLFANQVAA